MPDIVIEHDLSPESIRIIEALESASCGQDVYAALCEAPTANLKDMLNMITHILTHRGELN